jgi:transcriptional regulator with XRE-family HTH domain
LTEEGKLELERNQEIGKIIKQRRVKVPLTLQELAAKSGVSASHLGRIERGTRYPSGHVLRKIAKPLEFEEGELFALAGYLSPKTTLGVEGSREVAEGRLDPHVAYQLSQQPVEVQRTLVAILTILKNLAKQ